MVKADLITQEELTEMLGVRRETLWRWRRDGRGPVWIKLVGHIRYDRADVMAWLDDQKQGEEE